MAACLRSRFLAIRRSRPYSSASTSLNAAPMARCSGKFGRQRHGLNVKIVAVNSRNTALSAERRKVKGLQKVVDEAWLVAVEISDVERSVQRPERLGD